VTQVTADNDKSVKGVRYYLPKPYLLVMPQADGAIAVDVIYLPDKSRSYAVDPSSHWSSYTFQVARDEKGLLNAIEFKASTTAVGQQLAQSAGAAAVQAYNMRAAQLAAVQAQVNAAQAAVDLAQATLDAAIATLASHSGAGEEVIKADKTAIAQAEAKLAAAKQTLQRAQIASQAVATSAAAGTIVTTTAPAPGTGFPNQAWPSAPVYALPEMFGPVLFAINDSGTSVELKAVTAEMKGSIPIPPETYRGGVEAKAQRAFETVRTALPAPVLAPAEFTVTPSSKSAVYAFDRPVAAVTAYELKNDADETVDVPVVFDEARRTVTVATSKLKPGTYRLALNFSYLVDRERGMAAKQTVKLVVK
jgi:hypothetical protein